MARISKEWVEAYFEYGVDISNRRIFLFDDIEDTQISAVIKAMYFMDSQNKSDRKPIELFIGSFGGSMYDMFALYDVTRTLESPIHTVAIGKCMSAAPLLITAGEKGYRYATPNTYFMVHQTGDSWGDTRVDDVKKAAKHVELMNDKWYELMEKHTKKNKLFWKSICSKTGDEYFDAQTALEWGLVDNLWDEKDGY